MGASLRKIDRGHHAQEKLPYQANFDVDDGFHAGNVDGQRGFSVVRGEAQVLPGAGLEGSAGLQLQPSRPFGIVQLSIDAGLDAEDSPDRVVHTDFYVRPGAINPEEADQFADVEGSLTGFFKIDEQGELHIYDGGDEVEPGQWLPSGTRFDLDDEGNAAEWIRLSFRQDFAAGLWDVAINGSVFRANLAMADRAKSLKTIEFIGQSRMALYIDDVQVSREATAFNDANRNGLPDEWESEHGLSGLSVGGGRDDDPDGDGLTNVEELVLGTSPTIADTDGDGVNDGDEYASGTDPLVGNDSLESAALSWTGTDGMQVSISPYGSGYHFISVSWSSYTEWKIWVYNDLQYPYTYEYMTGDPVGNGSSNWTSSTDYVISTTGTAAFVYLWAKDHMNGGVENSVLFHVTSGTDGQLMSSYDGNSILNGGNLGAQAAAEDAIGQNCAGYCDPECPPGIGSVKLSISAGMSDFGNRSHYLNVHEPDINSRVFSRASIHFDATGLDAGYSSGTAGQPTSNKKEASLDWVRTNTQFTKLRDIPGGYIVEKYTLDGVNYANESVGELFHTTRIYNPDHPIVHATSRRLIVEQESDGQVAVHEYRQRYDRARGRETWELYEGELGSHLQRPLRLTRLVIDDPAAAERGDYTKTRTVHHWNPDTGRIELDTKHRDTYQRFDFGERKISQVVDPDGEALAVSLRYYSRQEADFPIAGRVKSIQFADGGWEYYVYDEIGRETRIYRPHGNTPLPVAEPAAGPGYEHVEIHYEGADYGEKRVRYRDGVAVETTFKRWEEDVLEKDFTYSRIIAAHPTASAGDPANRVTTVTNRAGDRRVLTRVSPNGSREDHAYSVLGDNLLHEITRRHANNEMDTKESKLIHPSGTVLEHKVIDGDSGILTKYMEVKTEALDDRFRPLVTLDHVKNEVIKGSYSCCGSGVSFRVDGNGLASKNEYDVLGRLVRLTRGYVDPLDPGETIQRPIMETVYGLDGNGKNLNTKNLLDQGTTPQSRATYDLAGRQTASTSRSGVTTQYKTIMLEGGGRLELTGLPKSGHDQRHRISSRKYSADGRLIKEMTYAAGEPFSVDPDPGTIVAHRLYDEGRDAKGRYAQVTDLANLFDRRTTRTYLDERGQKVEVMHAYGTPLAAAERFDYNDHGQLIRHIDPDDVTTRHAYNAKGERTVTAIDLEVEPGEAPDHIDSNVDRISRTTTELVRDADGREIRRVTNEVFKSGPIVTSISEQSLDGDFSATIQDGQRATRQRVDGEAPGQWSIIVTQPDRSHTFATYEDGRLARSTRYDSQRNAVSWTAQEYDASGRPWKTIDSRTGTTTVHYDENGRRWKVSAPNPQTGSSSVGTLDTIYHYDVLDQVVATTKPGGGVIHQVYNANGTLYKTHGHHTTDVEYRYNGRGERTHMITYYGPENAPAATRWAYNARGQLAFKQDAHGKRVQYLYTPGGKLKTRTWARGVITTYHYDADNHIDLRQIDYSDGTPAVAFTYDRLGRKQKVTDAGGVLTYAYDGQHLESETRDSDFQAPSQFLYAEPKTLTYVRDDFARPSGFQIGTETDPSQDYEVKYGYDLTGRLATVHAQGYGFQYGYEPNSTTDRVKTVTAPFVKQTEFTYELGRDGLASVANRVGFNFDQALSEFAYANDSDGRRTEKVITYSLPEPSSLSESYAYDPDTGGVMSVEVDSSNTDVPSPGSYGYVYDKIGNRQSAFVDDEETVYEANALNQYSSINGRSPSYDADGNLTAKDERTYRWDAENRMIEIHEHDTLIARYAYDHQSRRIARWTRDGVDERYLYDGWNLIAVYHASETEPAETYTWGKDLSGSLQGAGGVGGLLFAKTRDHGNDAWIYHYDANGNVTEVTSSRGQLLDRYAYDPFGNLIDDPQLPENRYRFSTKSHDSETGLFYYGYRYYQPDTGQWLSRDPIEEKGGINLYGFAANDPIAKIDSLGLNPNDAYFTIHGGQTSAPVGIGSKTLSASGDSINLSFEQTRKAGWGTQEFGQSQGNPAEGYFASGMENNNLFYGISAVTIQSTSTEGGSCNTCDVGPSGGQLILRVSGGCPGTYELGVTLYLVGVVSSGPGGITAETTVYGEPYFELFASSFTGDFAESRNYTIAIQRNGGTDELVRVTPRMAFSGTSNDHGMTFRTEIDVSTPVSRTSGGLTTYYHP